MKILIRPRNNYGKFLFLILSLLLFKSPGFAQVQFWGTTSAGGTYNSGTIFKTDSSGLISSVQQHMVYKFEGSNPYGNLVQANDGKLYGLTPFGGSNGFGVLFQFNPTTNLYTVKYNIGTANPNDGNTPRGSMIQAKNGNLYGMTMLGGNDNLGNIFSYNIASNIYSSLYDFNFTDGNTPYGSLLEASDGKLYGLTHFGGLHQRGTMFQFNPTTNQSITVIDFDSTEGALPFGSIMMSSDSTLYGMTSGGGINYSGVIFKYNTSTGIYTKVFDFDSLQTGRNPFGSLIQASDGMLYGMTSYGGVNGLGVLFQFNPNNNTLVKKVDFNGLSNGSNPWGDLFAASDGKIYGMTTSGGAYGFGIFFQYDFASNSFVKKKDFTQLDGTNPYGSPMQANNGKIYCMTQDGGTNMHGTVFQYDITNDTIIKDIDFNFSPNGNTPKASLLKASNGNLYGINSYGGALNRGVLFECDPGSNTFTKKIDLTSVSYGSLIEASNGKLYGMEGNIFEYDISSNQLTPYQVFSNFNLGSDPRGKLMQAIDGNLYGLTSNGGTNFSGVLFKFDPITHLYSKLFDFNQSNGKIPYGGLIQYTDGNLYGMTSAGGVGNGGVIFQYNPSTNTYTKKITFTNSNGVKPMGSLILGLDGMFYGLTNLGGINGLGVLFQYDPLNNTYTKKIDFDGTFKGSKPQGDLLQASDGNLYGMTSAGGTSNKGVVFKYNPITTNFTKIFNFYISNGSTPLGNLVEVNQPTSISEPYTALQLSIFPNPTAGKFQVNFESPKTFETGVWELYNSQGILLDRKRFNDSDELTINLVNYASGMYLLKMNTGIKTTIRKIILE